MMENKQIRLLVDAHVFDDEFQGTRTFLKGIYSHLLEKNNIHFFLAAHDDENLKKNFPGGIDRPNVTFIKYRKRSGLQRLTYEIPSLIRKYNIDYAHFQYITPP